ncbi:hypothetical protein TIFTF001_012921 [Ficus carica]|uniref:Uncharacterized protein n=1 Tax=Ficus carica TaxID=3494 RepID=A0AA88AP15_FICCA|nr:hypothetical protein TIFTF001_012921 [Ficus carica]
MVRMILVKNMKIVLDEHIRTAAGEVPLLRQHGRFFKTRTSETGNNAIVRVVAAAFFDSVQNHLLFWVEKIVRENLLLAALKADSSPYSYRSMSNSFFSMISSKS